MNKKVVAVIDFG